MFCEHNSCDTVIESVYMYPFLSAVYVTLYYFIHRICHSYITHTQPIFKLTYISYPTLTLYRYLLLVRHVRKWFPALFP